MQFLSAQGVIAARDDECGTGAFALLITTGLFWSATLAVLLFDGVQMYRGTLARPLQWLRTLPAAVAVILTLAVLLLS